MLVKATKITALLGTGRGEKSLVTEYLSGRRRDHLPRIVNIQNE
jgi:hypothetical protein